jgi:cell division topological specificity factor
MASLFERLMGRKEPTSAEIAKERLKLVLVTDRSNLSPERLTQMQAEIIQVIKRYIHINEMEVQIKIEQRDRKHYMVADIPLHREHAYEAMDGSDLLPEADVRRPANPEPAVADPPSAESLPEEPGAVPDAGET